MEKRLYVYSIGINKYKHFRTLSFCDNDARHFLDTIEQRVEPKSKHLYATGSDAEKSPTYNNFKKLIADISILELTDNDKLFLFFAGHGLSKEGKDYLVCSDSEQDSVENMICTDDVIAAMRGSGAGTSTLFVDACRCEVDRSPNVFSYRTAELARRKGVAAL